MGGVYDGCGAAGHPHGLVRARAGGCRPALPSSPSARCGGRGSSSRLVAAHACGAAHDTSPCDAISLPRLRASVRPTVALRASARRQSPRHAASWTAWMGMRSLPLRMRSVSSDPLPVNLTLKAAPTRGRRSRGDCGHFDVGGGVLYGISCQVPVWTSSDLRCRPREAQAAALAERCSAKRSGEIVRAGAVNPIAVGSLDRSTHDTYP